VFGNGIELVTSDPAVTAPFQVIRRNFSQAAEDLGLIANGSDYSATPTSVAGVETITGRDPNPAEVKGVFNSLIRLRDALISNNQVQLQRAIQLLDDDSLRLNLARGELGARQQGLDVLQTRLEDEVINLEDSLSKEQEVDLPSAISEMTARQASYEASLRTTASISRLTLLDFL
jgi:flagellar hook-associated protein 3 FlgL